MPVWPGNCASVRTGATVPAHVRQLRRASFFHALRRVWASPFRRRGGRFPRGRGGTAPPIPDQEIRCALEDLGTVRLVPVTDKASRRCREAMIDAWHPLGWSRSPGRQLRYWIRSSEHGLLGSIGFASASWHQKARDRWIGWCDDARVAHLNEIVCNQRFLLCPWVHVPNLASRVLAMATARLADDRERPADAVCCLPTPMSTRITPAAAIPPPAGSGARSRPSARRPDRHSPGPGGRSG